MELYLKVRLACSEGMSRRQAAKSLNISRDSVAKMLSYSTPPFAVDQNVGRFHSMFLHFTY